MRIKYEKNINFTDENIEKIRRGFEVAALVSSVLNHPKLSAIVSQLPVIACVR